NHALARAGMRNVAAIKGARRTARTAKRTAPPAVLHFPNLGLMLGTVTREGLSTLRKDGRVRKVVSAPQPRLIRPVRSAPAKLTAKVAWGIRFLNIPKLWDQGSQGKAFELLIWTRALTESIPPCGRLLQTSPSSIRLVKL